MGFEPTILYSLGRALLPTDLPGQLSRLGLKSTTQCKAKANLYNCAITVNVQLGWLQLSDEENAEEDKQPLQSLVHWECI